MNRDLTDYRKSYEKNTLSEDNLPDTPWKLFSDWFREVEEDGGVEEINAMTIATIGLDGFPKNRVVLLKHYDEQGFVFYTNYSSEKGKSLLQNPKTCLSFFWPNVERQVIIKGEAIKLATSESEQYFASRPRGSQLGAWASDQSAIISSRESLEQALQSLENKYQNKDIPKPPFWGGFRVIPNTIEFWQGRANRLHDRILYSLENKTWITNRLAP
ncbi:pyridoxamine 5'-phosphate oxidase [Aquimarina sp. U1-2]|uniref:pyridoxamine 5'-phosphate oxidase n=1 Tax=Aquimarina sp. U1-2 TaxID=2823141 RepID=UPI001AEC96A1|nr:pyridoxamine 5'-phosphate oxidase [Aquimarina sp. U1-2]MBP2833572.1 pyridoxamine 5'-phosphate oxidase [Aquimarina sp. U1-2]